MNGTLTIKESAMIKLYCPICECEREITPIQKEETYFVKKEPITILTTVCPCPVCGEKIMTMKYDDENLRQAYRIYRQRHNLLQPEEIKAIREQSGLSQKAFAEKLGVRENVISRCERGALQTEALNGLLVALQKRN